LDRNLFKARSWSQVGLSEGMSDHPEIRKPGKSPSTFKAMKFIRKQASIAEGRAEPRENPKRQNRFLTVQTG
jgi:hypothetical protein